MNIKVVKKLGQLALRNLFRNKRRTLITLLLVVVGFVAMGTARGYFVQTLDGLQQISIRSGLAGSLGTGHVVLKDSRYADDEENYLLEFGLKNFAELQEEITRIDGVSYALPRSQLTGLASSGERSIAFRGFAVDPAGEAELRTGLAEIAARTEGLSLGDEFKALGEEPYRASIGVGLARSLRAEIGDSILLLTATVDGAVNAIDVEVVDLITTGSDEVDKFFLVMSHETLSLLTGAESVGELSFMLSDKALVDTLLPEISQVAKATIPDRSFDVVGWEEAGDYYPAVRDLFTFMFGFLELIIIAIVLISNWNVVNMTVMERVKEIGTMRALGMSQKSIGSIFLLEGAFAGIIAVVLGFALQLVLVLLINNAEVQMPPPPGGNQGFILQVRYVTSYHFFIIASVIGAMIIANVSALLTIRRMTITNALDHV